MALLETNPNDSRIMELADKLNQIERNLRESPLYQLPPFPTDGDIPLPMALQLVSSIAVSGATKVVLNWIKPPNPNIDHFEVWVQRTAFQSENPYQIAAVDDAPAAFTITTDQDTAALMTVRTVMKNGLSTDLRSSPTAAVNVYKFVATAADIAAGAIGDSHFDRLTANKIVIENADIGSLNASKINAGYIAAGRLDVTVAYISDGAMIANAIIGNAHIADLSVEKLTAGTATFNSGVVFQGTGYIQVTLSGGIQCTTTITATGAVTGGSLYTSGALTANSFNSYSGGSPITFIDSSRNMTNLGTIGCGSIDSTGYISATTYLSFATDLKLAGVAVVIDSSLNAYLTTVDVSSGYKVATVSGSSGSFTTVDSKTVTVAGGIITAIV